MIDDGREGETDGWFLGWCRCGREVGRQRGLRCVSGRHEEDALRRKRNFQINGDSVLPESELSTKNLNWLVFSDRLPRRTIVRKTRTGR